MKTPLSLSVLLRLLLLLAWAHPSSVRASISFTDQSLEAGLSDAGEANGAAFGDWDGDGWPDLLVTRLGRGEQALLYRNQGDGRFSDHSDLLSSAEQTLGGVFLDWDGDGDQDIYLVHFRTPNQLYRNDGTAFVRADLPDSVQGHQAGTGAAFGDFDQDGVLDLFTTHRGAVANQFFARFFAEGFTDQSEAISSLRSGQDSFSATPFDYDGDGDLDLYVCNFVHPDLLHRNDGHGAFRQVAEALSLHHAGATIAAFPGDFDNDGDLDLYAVNALAQPNVLYRNDGPAGFADATIAAGVGGDGISAGAAWADFDNDGDLDLVVSRLGAPAIYANQGDGTFVDVSAEALPAQARSAGLRTAGVAVADYDRDGDVDVFLAGIGMPGLLLRNDSAAPGHWLRVELKGRGQRQTAVGARVLATTSDRVQMREYVIATALGSAHGDLLHFGLGPQDRVDELAVLWPSGQRQVLRDLGADRVLTLVEPLPQRDLRLSRVIQPDLTPGWKDLSPEVEVDNPGQTRVAGAMLKAEISRGKEVVYRASVAVPALAPGAATRLRLPAWRPVLSGAHRVAFALEVEDEVAADNTWERTHYFHLFVDVAPQLGVDDAGKGWAGAFADYDEDGDLDLYVANGGSLGRDTNVLYRNDGGQGFTAVTRASGVADEGNATGLVFADFDRDGFQDLFIAKGGFTPPGEAGRFFHNNGDGTFADISASMGLDAVQASYGVAAGDYDEDGYLDLYVSRFRGQFNSLYHNEGGGRFTDATVRRNILSSFQYSGSSAAFADYDDDGDLDLYAGIFGNYSLFYAEVGDSAFAVSSVGAQGDMVGLALGDYDGDGDIDVYTVDQDGRSALYRNEVEYLSFVDVGAQSGTENLAPGTGCAFGDYDNDGDLDLFVVNAQSPNRVYMNQGDGTFVDVARGLGMAEVARSEGVVLGDYDNDGDLDVYVVKGDGPNRLYRNDGTANNWLQTAVQGVQSNPDGIGTRLRAFAGDLAATWEVNGTSGFSQSSRLGHFGLGGRSWIDSLVVRWPRGQVDRYQGIPANTSLQLVEGQGITAVAAGTASRPEQFHLRQNYPNPFNSATAIEFGLEAPAAVRLTIYDAVGQQVRLLLDEEQKAGHHRAVWDGKDQRGQPAASGTYFCELRAGGRQERRSMLLLR